METEYIKAVDNSTWLRERIALRTREDNWQGPPLTEGQELLLENLQNDRILKGEQFKMLTEMAADIGSLWRSGHTIRVFFFGGENARSTKVLQIASEWSNHCTIKFTTSPTANDSDIRISFNPGMSWSVLGINALSVSKSEPTLNFGWLNASTTDVEYERVVLHEFGHVLGLLHEHQSPAKKVNWDKEEVLKAYAKEGYDEKWVEQNVFKEFDSSKTKYSQPDPDSIMAYAIPPEFTTDGQFYKRNLKLSKLDKEFIGNIYQ